MCVLTTPHAAGYQRQAIYGDAAARLTPGMRRTGVAMVVTAGILVLLGGLWGLHALLDEVFAPC